MEKKHHSLAELNWSYGALYGAMTGVFFSLCLWGYDSIQLAAAHDMFPFLKLLLGMLTFAAAFAVAGWLTARLDKAWIGLLSWVVAAWAVAWLMLGVPLKIMPVVMGWLRPELQMLLDYSMYAGLNARFLTSFGILAVFAAFLGLMENVLVEHATHAVALITRMVPLFISLVAMLVAGLIMDELINQQLRAAVVSVNRTIQYTLDHRGEEIDKTTMRTMHLAALNTVQDLLDRPRRLVVGTYDETFGEVKVLVDFDGEWAECMVFYNQLSNCKPLEIP